VRPHPRFGTIELRVMDVQSRLEDTVALAAYVQCLVKQILDEIRVGNPPIAYNRMLLSENKWLAARYGLEAPLMDLRAGKRIKVPARTLARRRIKELKPIARDLGCTHQLARVEWILDNGTGSMRQLQVWNANHDIREVAEEVADATESV
jgi:glutamate---cysteine ligase / carboxylate-amine ligase